MIPVSRLHALLDAGHTAAYDLAGDIRALIPGDGGIYSGGEVAQIREALRGLRALVDAQAEDEGLWRIYPMGKQPIVEAYLQQELRRLHAAVEACWPTGEETG